MKQQTLPWNVTGIPPEARQVARDAASRDGVSVGDWLTRRILDEAGHGHAESAAPDAAPYPAPATASNQDELGTRIAQVEAEADTAFRAIDETFRALSHRLEISERSQRDANRAMSAAAAEINAATHEQAQAFEALTQRIDRVERAADGGPLREAVRALHQALSRLAEQVANASTESSGQIGAIAGNVDSLTDKMTAAQREFAQQVTRVAELSDQLSERLKVAEERLTLVTPLEDVVLQLQVRMTTVEDHFKEAIGRNFEGIERNLETIGARLERIERSQSLTGTQADATLRALNDRLDEIDLRSNESLTDLRAGLEAVTKRLDAEPENVSELVTPATAVVEGPPHAGVFPEANAEAEIASTPDVLRSTAEAEIPPIVEVAVAPASDEFDLPPFPESPPFPSENFAPARAEEEMPASTAEHAFNGPYAPSSPGTEHYLASARRAARAAAQAEAQHVSRSPLGSVRSGVTLDHRGRTSPRIRPIVAAVLLILLTTLAGFLVTRSVNPFASAPIAPAPPKAAASLAPTLPAVQGPQDFSGQTEATSTGTDGTAVAPQDATPDVASPDAASSTDAVASTPTPQAIAPQASAAAAPLDRLLAKAKAGSTPAALLLGIKYADGDGVAVNDGEAVRWLTDAAQHGEALAQYRLGTFYERGRGVTTDNAQAFFWYKQAATSGNSKAMHNLAVAYADGLGTDKNFTEAARWFRSAAELGLTDSQFNLAVLYERGLGVAVSQPEAYKWYVIAAAGGDAESKIRANALGAQLPPPQRQAGDKAAESFSPKPADRAANEPPDLAAVAP